MATVAGAEIKLIVPRATDASYMTQLLKLLPFQLSPERLIPYDTRASFDSQYVVGELFVAQWDPVNVTGALPNPKAPFMPPSLPSRALLLSVRDMLAGVPGGAPAAGRPALVYASRRGERMRTLADAKERELVDALAAVAKAAGVEFVNFLAKDMSTAAALQLFRRAAAVVGVHGGALTNAVVCRPGALMVELGFASPFALHYAHMAAALSLQYELLDLQADSRGMAAPIVWTTPGTVETVVRRVQRHLAGSYGAGAGRSEL
jgi:hypothetical protein